MAVLVGPKLHPKPNHHKLKPHCQEREKGTKEYKEGGQTNTKQGRHTQGPSLIPDQEVGRGPGVLSDISCPMGQGLQYKKSLVASYIQDSSDGLQSFLEQPRTSSKYSTSHSVQNMVAYVMHI